MVDHGKLLIKYIQYIEEMEGTDYLGYERRHLMFSEIEWDELRKLAEEEPNIDYRELLIKYIQYNIQECDYDKILSEDEWKELGRLTEEALKRIEIVKQVETLLGHEQFQIISITNGTDFTEQEKTWVKVKDLANNRWVEIEITDGEARINTIDSLV